ncbi:hypothetical protein Rcae01_01377 [Novipirellula caenicola]|uniref:Uncharacterized protein n=1 Tax=Novipirellula caenicola TaxID=1536901 RepID=A0ABP9VQA4_9BACT
MNDRKMKAAVIHFPVTHFPVYLFRWPDSWARSLGTLVAQSGMVSTVSRELVYRKMNDKKMKATVFYFPVTHFPVSLFVGPDFWARLLGTLGAQSAWGRLFLGSCFTGR